MPSGSVVSSRHLIATLAVTALAGAGCSDGREADAAPSSSDTQDAGEYTQEAAEQAVPAVIPSQEWEMIEAGAAGMDSDVLDAVAADAEAGQSNCLLVTRGGKLVNEWYWQGTGPESTQEVFSAAKSYTSVLVGMAVDDGALSVSDKASQWIPQWEGTPSEDITVEQLLNNTSGRFQDFETDYVEMAAKAEDKTAFSIALDQQHEPGSTWVYNNAAIQALEEVFSAATGQDMAEYADKRLFEPLGMQESRIIRDRAGNPLAFMGVQSTCRDMARFGLMALRQGDWGGDQVVSQDWMDQSTGRSSQELNAGYGWLWWVNHPGKVLGGERASGDPEKGEDEASRLVEGAPEDMFFALGLGGQMIGIDPGTETVVVRLGPSGYPDGVEKFEREDLSRVATEAVVNDMSG